jgi:maleate isomerase
VTGPELTVGVVTPHAAPGPEVELPALSHDRVGVVVARAGSPSDLLASTDPGALEPAARTLRAARVGAVAHASTTTGYVIGRRAEAALVERLEHLCGVPATASGSAAVEALRAGAVERVQLVHPPWFDGELDALGVGYFRDHGFDAWVTRAEDLPDDPAAVRTDQVVTWLEHHLDDRAEAVFLAGNGFRAAAAGADVERRTERLVVSANQALLRAVLSATGAS